MTVKKAFQNMIVLDAVCGQKDFYDEEFRQAILTAERSLEAWENVKEEVLKTQTYIMFEGDTDLYVERKDVLKIIDKHLKEVENADSHKS